MKCPDCKGEIYHKDKWQYTEYRGGGLIQRTIPVDLYLCEDCDFRVDAREMAVLDRVMESSDTSWADTAMEDADKEWELNN